MNRSILKKDFLEIEELLKNPIKDINSFTDEFLKVFSEYQEKVRLLLSGKSEGEIREILDKNTDKKIKRAIDLIISFSKPEEKKL
jgi:hypothetical protein